jgi:hypothetical protein
VTILAGARGGAVIAARNAIGRRLTEKRAPVAKRPRLDRTPETRAHVDSEMLAASVNAKQIMRRCEKSGPFAE